MLKLTFSSHIFLNLRILKSFQIWTQLPQEVREGFLNGCDRAARLKMEASLMVINQCYNLLESEHEESKESDGLDKQEVWIIDHLINYFNIELIWLKI